MIRLNQFYPVVLAVGSGLLTTAFAGFAIVQLVSLEPVEALAPLHKGKIIQAVVAILMALVMIFVSALSIVKGLRLFAFLVSGFLLCTMILALHLPRILGNMYEPTYWTAALQTLAIASGSLLVGFQNSEFAHEPPAPIVHVARSLFGICLIVFGVQHFLYADFIVTMMPDWFPAKTFHQKLVTAGLVGASLLYVANRFINWASAVMSILFFSWVVIIHLPDVVRQPGNAATWQELFIALALAGISLGMITYGRQERKTAPVIPFHRPQTPVEEHQSPAS